MKLLLASALVALAVPALAQTSVAPLAHLASAAQGVEGRVVGGGGAPLPGGHVHLSRTFLGYDAERTVAVGPDGRFRLPIDAPGLYNVFVTAPDHAYLQVPVEVAAGETVEVEVHLAPHPGSALQSVHLVRPDEERVPMAARDDGTFTVTVASRADTLAYQVAGTTGTGRTVNGTMHDRLVEDGGYDYWSVLDTTPGDSVTVVFHPDRAVRGGGVSTARFADPASTSARLAAVLEEAYWTNVRTVAARDSVLRSHAQPGMSPAAIAADSTVKAAVHRAVEEVGGADIRADLADRAKAEADPLVRGGLYAGALQVQSLLRFFGVAPDSLLARAALDAIPPHSPLWSTYFQLLTVTLVNTAPSAPPSEVFAAYSGYVDEVIRTNEAVAAEMLFVTLSLAAQRGDTTGVVQTYNELVRRFPDSGEVQMAQGDLPDRAIMAGKSAPGFQLPALGGGSEAVVDLEDLRGQTVLLDFWATWCSPCVEEIPLLTELYETYRDRGFTILSVSFDDSPDYVAAFRENRAPMPWLHAFGEGGLDGPFAQVYEIVGLPKPVLVGPDGTVLATEDALRGEALRRTLADVFGAPR